MRISKVGIVAKPTEEAVRVALDSGRFLSEKGIDVVYSPEVNPPEGCALSPPERMSVDLVVVVGGDGTIIRTAQKVGETPMLGIKVGARGFLCETIPKDAFNVLGRVVEGDGYVEYKTRLEVKHNGRAFPPVLNEVLVTSAKPSKVIRFSLSANGGRIYEAMADGVLVSTTTGSTAYALSAGGPIIDPEMDAIEVAFICPLSYWLRPMVFPPSFTVEVEILQGTHKGVMVLDGQAAFDVKECEPIIIERSKSPAVFLRVNPPNFYGRVRKLLNVELEDR